MSLFGDLFVTKDEKTKATEAALREQIKQLQNDLKESNAKVEESRKEREQAQQEIIEKEQRAADVKAKAKAQQALARHTSATREAAEGGCFSCFEGSRDRSSEMKKQVEKLQEQLAKSKEQVSQARGEAKASQKNMTKAEREAAYNQYKAKQAACTATTVPTSSQSNLVKERTESFTSMFAKEVKDFRSQTPANQRSLKGTIIELLNKLQNSENELQEEETLKKQIESDAKQHDKTVNNLQGRIRDQPFAFLQSGNSTALFRSATPAQQREMKDELLQLLQDLEAVEVEKSEQEVLRDANEQKLSALRKRTGTEEAKVASKNSGFAFQQ